MQQRCSLNIKKVKTILGIKNCFAFLLLWGLPVFVPQALCADISVSVATSSPCASSNSLTVKLDGDLSGLSQISYTVKGGSVERTSTNPEFLNLPGGTYTVQVHGLLDGAAFEKATTAVVAAPYTSLSVEKLQAGSTIGTRSTFNCVNNTGRVQFKITKGKFPYIVITSKGGAVVRTDTFRAPQNSGTDANSPDYKDYYSIENLEAGAYSFKVTDGCYDWPPMNETVGTMTRDFSATVNGGVSVTLAPAGYYLARIILSFPSDYSKYTYEHSRGKKVWWEYSYSRAGGAYSAWKDVPAGGDAFTINDTIRTVTNYCEIWGNEYAVRVRVKGCADNSEGVSTKTIWRGIATVANPSSQFKCDANIAMIDPASANNSSNNIISFRINGTGESTWGEYAYSYDGGPLSAWRPLPVGEININDTVKSAAKYCDIWGKKYTFEVRQKGCSSASICTTTKTVPKPSFGESQYIEIAELGGCVDSTLLIQYGRGYSNSAPLYYTCPVRVQITDTAAHKVLRDTVINSIFWDVKMGLTHNLYGKVLHINVTDKNGCRVVDTLHTVSAWALYPPQWDVYEPWCGGDITISYNASYPPQNTVVELIESPGNNYRYKMVYNRTANRWTVTKTTTTGRDYTVAAVGGTVSFVDAKSLLSGTYKWRITDDCGRIDTIVRTYEFYTYSAKEHLTYIGSKTNCDGTTYHPQGEIVRKRDGTGAAETLPTYFRIRSGTAGGYKISDDNKSFGEMGKDSITITLNGNYVIEMYHDRGCVGEQITIEYRIGVVNFKGAVGYACTATDVLGKIFIEADSSTSMPPYIYTVRSASRDFTQTNQTGLFENIGSVGETFYVQLQDNCGGGITPQEVTIMAIDGNFGVNRKTTLSKVCYQSTVRLRGQQIGIGKITNYRWTSPRGEVFVGQDIDIPNATAQDAGKYSVDVLGLSCEIKDEIEITIEQTIRVFMADTICQGNPYSNPQFDFPENPATLPAGTHVFAISALNVDGCDSVTTFTLTVNPIYDYLETVVVCETDLSPNYAFEDTLFAPGTLSGTYVFRRRTNCDCDSITTLDLTVNPVYEQYLYSTICDNIFPYTEEDTTFLMGTPHNDVYTFVRRTVCDCDSIIHLDLTVNEAVQFSILNNEIITCADSDTFTLNYELQQSFPHSYSITLDAAAHNARFEIEDLIPSSEALSITAAIPPDIVPNLYHTALRLHNEHCTSEVPFDITFYYSSTVMGQKWNDVIAVKNPHYIIGGHEFSAFQWFKDGVPMSGATGSYIYTPPQLDFDADYRVDLTRVADGVTLLTCPLRPVPHVSTFEFPIVYPTVVNRGESITVRLPRNGQLSVLNHLGAPLKQQALQAPSTDVQAPNEQGIYFFEVKSIGGSTKTEKVMVR